MILPEIVEQLESCGYQCEAGALENNVAFIELKQMAINLGCVKWGEKSPGVYGPCGECVVCRLAGDQP